MLHDDFTNFKYGHRCYRLIDDVRHLVGVRPTVRPEEGETEYAFELRVQRYARLLGIDPNLRIETCMKHADGRIVECELDIRLVVPEPAPITDLGYVTSRRATPRGGRGGGSKNGVPASL